MPFDFLLVETGSKLLVDDGPSYLIVQSTVTVQCLHATLSYATNLTGAVRVDPRLSGTLALCED